MSQQSLATVAADPRPVVRWIAETYGAPSAVGATFLVGRLAYATAAELLPRVVAGEHIPSLEPGEVFFTWTESARATDLTFTAATTTTSFASEMVAAFGPLVSSVRAVAAVGRRRLWGMVADAVGAAACGLGPTAVAASDQVLDELELTCSARPTWVTVSGGTRDHLFQRRSTCCLAFRIDGHGYCTSCPSVSDDERLRRLRASVEGHT